MTPRIAATLAVAIGGPLLVAVWIWRTVNDIDNAIDGVDWGTCPDVVDLDRRIA